MRFAAPFNLGVRSHMKYLLALSFASGMTQICVTKSSAESHSAGPFSRALSTQIIVGVRVSVDQSGNATDSFKKCVQAVDSTLLAPAIESTLRNDFLASELEELDHFAGSDLGTRYARYSLDGFLQEHGVQRDSVVLSPEEEAALRAFFASTGGQRYMSVMNQRSARIEAAVRPTLDAMLEGCEAGL